MEIKLRGVAQPGSALAWGASGRQFKSARPDQIKFKIGIIFATSMRDVSVSLRNHFSRANP